MRTKASQESLLTAKFCHENPVTTAIFPRNTGIRRYFASNCRTLSSLFRPPMRLHHKRKFDPGRDPICLGIGTFWIGKISLRRENSISEELVDTMGSLLKHFNPWKHKRFKTNNSFKLCWNFTSRAANIRCQSSWPKPAIGELFKLLVSHEWTRK